MKYNQPYGISDPDAPYINGNPSTGTMGSIPPAASIEHDQREVVEVITRANTRGYRDFSDTLCAPATDTDLQQLRKAIEGFVRALPLEFSDLIDSAVEFTVHGTTPDFPDLFTALHYLSKYKITQHGRVILQLAGSTGGAASQFTYTEKVVFDHPQNHRIFVFGKAPHTPIPTSSAGYTLTGNDGATRASNVATNLAMLRLKFATEIRFTTNGRGIEIMGTNLATLDALLITSDGTVSGDGVFNSCGITITASDTELYQGYLLAGPPPIPGGRPAKGVAVVGFAGANFYFGQGGNSSAFGLGFPLVSMGAGAHGFMVNGGGLFQPVGVCLSYSNVQEGFVATSHSWMHFDSPGCESACNGGVGVKLEMSTGSFTGAKVWRNAAGGFFADVGSAMTAQSTVMSVPLGSNFNGNNDAKADRMSYLSVAGMTGSNGNYSPTIGSVGNNNSLIQG